MRDIFNIFHVFLFFQRYISYLVDKQLLFPTKDPKMLHDPHLSMMYLISALWFKVKKEFFIEDEALYTDDMMLKYFDNIHFFLRSIFNY